MADSAAGGPRSTWHETCSVELRLHLIARLQQRSSSFVSAPVLGGPGSAVKLRVFTLCLDPSTGAFDDGEVQAFLAEREALSVSEHFFTWDGTPTWALLVTYREPAPESATWRRGAGPPATELSEPERALYEALRRWRNDRARRDGRPAYVLFNNRQLADIARLRPTSLAALQEVDGVGEGKARSYGEEVLGLLAAAPADPDPPADSPEEHDAAPG